MITNEKQYKITFSAAEKFKKILANLADSESERTDVHPRLLRAERKAVENQIEDLMAELKEYEALQTSEEPVSETEELGHLRKNTSTLYNNHEKNASMNKNDFVSAVAKHSGLSKTDAGRAVDAVFTSIEDASASGASVRIVGFGSISVAHHAATTGRSQHTGTAIKIASSKQTKARAEKSLMSTANN